jgi:D-beta-D-heptose 7-phosphate kinase/D-beta-D-heptose 1-phosphate adenosyltransferase
MIRAVPVLVYGDVILDIMAVGGVTRMSPEAPQAPVVAMTEWDFAPGGAANVAATVSAMGGCAKLIGMTGDDPAGQMLRSALQEQTEVDFLLLARGETKTTIKIRIVGNGAQIARVDIEQAMQLAGEDEDEILARVRDAARKARVVVISDYAKGAVTPPIACQLIAACTALDVPVVVDAKAPDAKHFHGAQVLKPNLVEIARALGIDPPQTDPAAAKAAQALRKKCHAQCVVLTRGAQGVTLAGEPGEVHVAGHPVTAIDVTGAGDAVAGGLALALASGAGILDAARFANAAGAAAVTKRGTRAPTFDEINFFYDCNSPTDRRAKQGMAGEGLHGRMH